MTRLESAVHREIARGSKGAESRQQRYDRWIHEAWERDRCNIADEFAALVKRDFPILDEFDVPYLSLQDYCDYSRDGFKKVYAVFTAFGEQFRLYHNQWPCSYRLVTSESHSYIVEDEPTLIHALTGWKQTH